MRLKFFLRGVGMGIIITTIILSIAHSASRKMSDNEIIERARQLGMSFGVSNGTPGQTGTTEAAKPTDTATEGTTQKPTEAPTKKPSETATQKPTEGTTQKPTETTTQKPTETTTQKPTEGTTQKPTEAATGSSGGEQSGDAIVYTLNIVGGMSSNMVSRLLRDNGIIADDIDFDNYLVRNGLADRIRVGSFQVRSTMTYDELASVFCSR